MFTWEEFGWESPEQPAYLTAPARYKALADKQPVEFVTCKEYLDKYGAGPKETVYLPMDAWNKSLTWGLGGDQLRIMDRKVEAIALGGGTFDAVAATLGRTRSQVSPWTRHGKTSWPRRATTWACANTRAGRETGWRRWTGSRTTTTSPGARSATTISTPPKSKARLCSRLPWATSQAHQLCWQAQQGRRAVTVFNPSGYERSDLVLTGRIYPIAEKAAGVVVRDRAGTYATLLKSSRPTGTHKATSWWPRLPLRPKRSRPSDTTPISSNSPARTPRQPARWRIDEARPNAGERARPGAARPDHGRRQQPGRQASRAAKCSTAPRARFPCFTGRPNPNLSLGPKPPPATTAPSRKRRSTGWKKARCATVRARHKWQYLTFETRVTLTAGLPYVEVISRFGPKCRRSRSVHPADIKEGYWFSLAPAFQPTRNRPRFSPGRRADPEERLPRPHVRRFGRQGRRAAGAAQGHPVVPERRAACCRIW